MRVGQNPNRTSRAYPVGPLVLSVLTHLPDEEGYHEKRFEVIKLCLNSLRYNCDIIPHVLIWDNGSCPKLLDWLINEYKPDTLVLSKNVGKTFAMNSIIRMLPQDTLIGFSDDDCYYEKNFFTEQLILLQSFMNVALVTGNAIRSSFRWGCINTIKWAKENALLETGRFISDEQEKEFAISIGRDPEYHIKSTPTEFDYRVTYKGVRAYCTGHHFQFMGYQNKLVQACDVYDGLAMAPMRVWDEKIDKIGLRLATIRRCTRHIGNVIDAGVEKEARADGVI